MTKLSIFLAYISRSAQRRGGREAAARTTSRSSGAPAAPRPRAGCGSGARWRAGRTGENRQRSRRTARAAAGPRGPCVPPEWRHTVAMALLHGQRRRPSFPNSDIFEAVFIVRTKRSHHWTPTFVYPSSFSGASFRVRARCSPSRTVKHNSLSLGLLNVWLNNLFFFNPTLVVKLGCVHTRVYYPPPHTRSSMWLHVFVFLTLHIVDYHFSKPGKTTVQLFCREGEHCNVIQIPRR